MSGCAYDFTAELPRKTYAPIHRHVHAVEMKRRSANYAKETLDAIDRYSRKPTKSAAVKRSAGSSRKRSRTLNHNVERGTKEYDTRIFRAVLKQLIVPPKVSKKEERAFDRIGGQAAIIAQAGPRIKTPAQFYAVLATVYNAGYQHGAGIKARGSWRPLQGWEQAMARKPRQIRRTNGSQTRKPRPEAR
jgi:hypothetical protein